MYFLDKETELKKLSRKVNSRELFVILIKFSKDLIQYKEEEKQAHHCQKDIDQCIFCFFEVFSFSSIDDKLISSINNHQYNHSSTQVGQESRNCQNKISCLLCEVLLRSNIIEEIHHLETDQGSNNPSQICDQFFPSSLLSARRIHHLKSCPHNHHYSIKERTSFE